MVCCRDRLHILICLGQYPGYFQKDIGCRQVYNILLRNRITSVFLVLVIFGRIFVFALMFEYCIYICSCKFVSTRGFGSLQYDTWDNKTLKPAHTDHTSKSLSFWNLVFVFVFVFAEVHHGRRGGAYCRKAPATWLLLTTGYFHSGAIVHSRPTPSSETTTLLFSS